MTLDHFNQFLQVTSGINITSGTLHGANFDFELVGGSAAGQFAADYQDFDLAVVNPATGKQSLGARLRTVIAGIMVRGSNRPDAAGRLASVPVRYSGDSNDSFWGLIWRGLRSGIVRQLKH